MNTPTIHPADTSDIYPEDPLEPFGLLLAAVMAILFTVPVFAVAFLAVWIVLSAMGVGQ
jgi:hypothetical protein